MCGYQYIRPAHQVGSSAKCCDCLASLGQGPTHWHIGPLLLFHLDHLSATDHHMYHHRPFWQHDMQAVGTILQWGAPRQGAVGVVIYKGHTLMPMASSRRSRRRLSTANGNAGLATRQVSSRNTLRPPSTGIAYKNDGTSASVPHSPSPALGCSPGCSLKYR
jgi:hypothetical protein